MVVVPSNQTKANILMSIIGSWDVGFDDTFKADNRILSITTSGYEIIA